MGPKGLRELCLDFTNCCEVTDFGVEVLSQELPECLQALELKFVHCKEIGKGSVLALAKNLPPGVMRLSVMMRGTKVDRTFESPNAIRRFAARINGTAFSSIVTNVRHRLSSRA